jgi:hypothetical protein
MGTRRQVLTSFAALGALIASHDGRPQSERSEKVLFDPAQPDQAYEVLIRLIGSLTTGIVYAAYSGVVFVVSPGAATTPLLRYQGITKTHWFSLADGGMRSRRFDVMTFADYKTREPITRLLNPLTAEELDVPVIASGPETLDHSRELVALGKRAMYAPANWQQSAAEIIHGYELAFTYKHPLQPKDWPKASPGESGFATLATTFEAPKSEALDRRVSSARALHTWVNLTSWSPWLHMGQRTGSLLWRGRGVKGLERKSLPQVLVSTITNHAGDFFGPDEPWQTRRDEFQQYIQSRRG